MGKKIGYIFLLLTCSLCYGQQTKEQEFNLSLRFVDSSKTYTYINNDRFGNIYACDGAFVYKFDEKGQLLFSYSSLLDGKIDKIDTYNPLKVLIFSKDFLQVSFLDKQLAKQNLGGKLDAMGIFLPISVCSSYDNGFWVFDLAQDQLIRFDANERKSNNSPILSTIISQKVEPTDIQESEAGLLIVNDPKQGLLIFDRFGSYIKTIPITNLDSFSTYKHLLVFFDQENNLNLLNINNLESAKVSIPYPSMKQVCIGDQQMVSLDKEGKLYCFSFSTK